MDMTNDTSAGPGQRVWYTFCKYKVINFFKVVVVTINFFCVIDIILNVLYSKYEANRVR